MVTDEQIISALLTHGTKRAAAKKLGISESTIYDRIKDSKFRAAYASAREDILREATSEIQKQMLGAIKTVADIMNTKANNAAVRLQAAQTIINNASRFAEALTKAEDRTRGQESMSFFNGLLS